MRERQLFLCPTPERVARWYRDGYYAALEELPPKHGAEKRYWAVIRFIAATGVKLEDLVLLINNDPDWGRRLRRTRHEGLARRIGQSTRDKRPLVFWAVPKESA